MVNCAGLGARELVPDPGVTPLRGQTIRVRMCTCTCMSVCMQVHVCMFTFIYITYVFTK